MPHKAAPRYVRRDSSTPLRSTFSTGPSLERTGCNSKVSGSETSHGRNRRSEIAPRPMTSYFSKAVTGDIQTSRLTTELIGKLAFRRPQSAFSRD